MSFVGVIFAGKEKLTIGLNPDHQLLLIVPPNFFAISLLYGESLS